MRRVVVVVKRDDEWSAVLKAIRDDHYHLLAGRSDVALKEELDLLLKSPGGLLLEFEARVLRVTPGKGAALEVYARDDRKPPGWRKRAALAEIPAHLSADVSAELSGPQAPGSASEFDSGVHAGLQADTADVTAPDVCAPTATAPVETAAPVGPAAPAPADTAAPTLHARLAQLSVSEKQKLALSAERSERALLIRDNLKQVHVFVLKNPRVTDEEVAEYVRYAGLSAQALGYVADNVRWMRSPQLRFELVKNPQVPPDVARRVIETLGVTELRYLAKADRVKTDVRQAARKYLEKKGLL
jgi:hypothetical protein